MNISVLNNSVRVSVDIDTDAAVNAIATNVALLTYSVTKFVLDRAVEDTRKVYNEVSKVASVVTDKAKRDIDTVITAGRNSGIIVEDKLNTSYDNAKVTVVEAIANAQETRDAVIAATQVKVAKAVDSKIVKPTEELTAQIAAPIKAKVAQVERAIADYTRIDEVEASAEVIADSIQQDESTVTLMEETPQVIDGALVTSAGVTPAVISDEHKPARNLTDLIKEEAAKHS